MYIYIYIYIYIRIHTCLSGSVKTYSTNARPSLAS